MFVNELIQLKQNDVRIQAQNTTSQPLYAALDKCRDVVLVTDDIYRLQVVGIKILMFDYWIDIIIYFITIL